MHAHDKLLPLPPSVLSFNVLTCAIGPFDYLGVHKVSRTVSDIMGYRLFNMFLEVSYQFWNGFVRKVERVSARRMDTRIVR